MTASAPLLSRLRDESGSQIVEFGLVLIPLMGLVFLILDIAWVCFAQESLQHAVQMGVHAPPGSIESVVRSNAMGFLGEQGPSNLRVQYTGNIVEVTVKDVPVSLLGPAIESNWTSIRLTATSSGVINGTPGSP
jgi:Flp pilus assembly protein TadG